MSRPIHVEESVTLARSPEAVWSVVADYGTGVAQGPDRHDAGPAWSAAVGTKVHEVLKTGGRSYVADSTVTQVRGDLARLRELLEQS
jgi:hypothetical protein